MQILVKQIDEDPDAVKPLTKTIKELIKRVYPILDLLSPGKVDFKEIAHLYGEAIDQPKGRRSKQIIQQRETIIKKFIGDSRTLLYEAKDLVRRASSAPATQTNVIPPTSGVISGLNPAMSGYYQPTMASLPTQSKPESKVSSPELDAAKTDAIAKTTEYFQAKKLSDAAKGEDKVKLEADTAAKMGVAEQALERLVKLGMSDEEVQKLSDSVKFDLLGSGRRRRGGSGVKNGADNINTMRLRSKNLKGEYAVAKQFDEPSMNFKPLSKSYGRRVNRLTEGNGMPKMKSKKRIILFEEI